ncbi:hypothetical protein [Pseudarthrobacter niigatensis]|uniref:Uncharacterized protein n=1 Tax=Pseudarthrobacter niigatensis TaxID=369935 RepID=A0AAJ1WET4_9MICC|nr:hypothetical protein [Pseudarthrobacter niigatensis]MDQ0144975.1 hypothetical protein [Pseudarthrobacter niigatensis]MDQ0264412.1 hypothetical protein [Pseudarthrobacter niigatensis]
MLRMAVHRILHRTRARPLHRTPPPQTVGLAWHSGYQRIFILKMVRAQDSFFTPSRATALTLALCVLVSSTPALINHLLLALNVPIALGRDTEIKWLWGFAAIDFIVLLASVGAWTVVARRTADLDHMVSDTTDAALVSGWLNRKLSFHLQAPPPVFSAIAAVAFIYLVQEPISPFIHVSLASYLSVFWTAFIGGNSLYWLYVAPGMVSVIARCQHLHLWWQNPAMTPALRALSDGLAFSASAVLTGGICATFLGFFGPQTVQVPLIQVLLIGFFVVVMLSAVQVVLAPTIHIYAMIRRRKFDVLRKISDEVGDLERVLKRERTYDVEFSSLFLAVAETPNLPFSTSTVVQYSAGFAATIAGFVISQLVK